MSLHVSSDCCRLLPRSHNLRPCRILWAGDIAAHRPDFGCHACGCLQACLRLTTDAPIPGRYESARQRFPARPVNWTHASPRPLAPSPPDRIIVNGVDLLHPFPIRTDRSFDHRVARTCLRQTTVAGMAPRNQSLVQQFHPPGREEAYKKTAQVRWPGLLGCSARSCERGRWDFLHNRSATAGH